VRNACKFFIENLEEADHLGDLYADGRMLLGQIVKK
jgi:hypothetical protein